MISLNPYTKPHFLTSALLIVDAQRAFISEGATGRDLKLETVPVINKVLDIYREAKLPIIHIVRIYLPDGSNVDICRKSKVEEEGSNISPEGKLFYPVEELLPSGTVLNPCELLKGEVQSIASNEVVIYKPRFGAFYGTCLKGYLESSGVDTLVVTGFNYPNCPRATIYEASDRDFKVVVPQGAISHMTDRDSKEIKTIGVCVVKPEKLVAMMDEEEFLA